MDKYEELEIKVSNLEKKVYNLERKLRWVSCIEDSDDRIEEVLKSIGVPMNLKGFQYLYDCISIAISNNGSIHNITKDMYQAIAKNRFDTPCSVERAIRHAIETTWYNSDTDALNSIFGNTVSIHRGRPTCSQFIAAVSRYIIKINEIERTEGEEG